MYERRGLTPPGSQRRPIGSLPTSARVPSQYPAGVPTGVGGGNAGASRAKQWSASAAATRSRPPVPAPGARTAVIRGNFSGGSRMSNAIQNAAAGTRTNGLGVAAPPAPPPSPWAPGVAEYDAADAAGTAAAAARSAQGGRGYLSAGTSNSRPLEGAVDFSATPNILPGLQGTDWAVRSVSPEVFSAPSQPIGADFGRTPLTATKGMDYSRVAFDLPPAAAGALPDTSNPASQAYWDRADIKSWAGANKELADELRARHGLAVLPQPQADRSTPSSRSAPTADQAVMAAQAAGALSGLRPGATTDDAILAGQAAGVFDRGIPGPQGPPAPPVAPAVAPAGQDPVARVVPAQMPSTGDTAFDPAQALLRGHLDKISQNTNFVLPSGAQDYNPWSNPELLNRRYF